MTDQELVDLYADRPGHSLNQRHIDGLRRLAWAVWEKGYGDDNDVVTPRANPYI